MKRHIDNKTALDEQFDLLAADRDPPSDEEMEAMFQADQGSDPYGNMDIDWEMDRVREQVRYDLLDMEDDYPEETWF